MKKKISIMLSLLLSVGVLAGCSNSSKDSSLTSKGNGGEIKITVWQPDPGPGKEKDSVNTAVKGFNDLNKGKIQVDLKFIPRGNSYEYENKISAAATSHTVPDIIKMDGPNVTNYADAGIIVPLDDYFTADEKNAFVPSIIEQGTYKDKLYALGETESDVVLFYNKKMLSDAGITPPTKLEDAWTWDDLYDAAKKLTTKDVYGLNLTWDAGEGQIYAFAPFIWSNGGELISKDGKKCDGYVNHEKSVEAITYLQKFAKDKLINLQAVPNEFENGKAAMLLMGTWEIQTLKKFPNIDYGITYYPASPKTKKVVSPSGDWCWGVSSDSKNPKEAAEFIKYMTSAETSYALAEGAGKPAANKAALDKQAEYNTAPMTVIKDQVLKTAQPRPHTTSYPILSKEFSNAMLDIFKGADVKATLDRVAKKVDDDIANNKR